METINETSIIERRSALEQWLKDYSNHSFVSIKPMPGDASFRRYFRVTLDQESFVVMDAPPPQENIQSFAAISHALRRMQLNAPEIITAEWERGFLLLTDFGDATYLSQLNSGNANQLYDCALNALVVLQACKEVDGMRVPPFTSSFMWQEWAWHKEWFLDKWLGLTLSAQEEQALNQCYDAIVDSATTQPQVFMHRDYHSANLMVLPNQGVGLLDFQDAFIGPLTYDLVSLLRDCYISWPNEKVTEWALRYLQKLQQANYMCDVSQQVFLRWFDWMGIERHLKALFTFARKQVRDQHPHYLKHIPRTLAYIETVSQHYPELSALHAYIQKVKTPALTKVNACAQ